VEILEIKIPVLDESAGNRLAADRLAVIVLQGSVLAFTDLLKV